VSIRIERISEQVRAEIARILRDEISDPRVGLLSLTRVKVSKDLSQALIFWSPLDVEGETDIEETQAGLESATGYIRRELARLLDLRRTPAPSFRYDPSIQEGSRTLSLMREVRENERKRGNRPEEPGTED
jgi:ribosome-binding factor A